METLQCCGIFNNGMNLNLRIFTIAGNFSPKPLWIWRGDCIIKSLRETAFPINEKISEWCPTKMSDCHSKSNLRSARPVLCVFWLSPGGWWDYEREWEREYISHNPIQNTSPTTQCANPCIMQFSTSSSGGALQWSILGLLTHYSIHNCTSFSNYLPLPLTCSQLSPEEFHWCDLH